jgi:hypothetical protein
MALYMHMILNRGQINGTRIVSEASFKLFSTPHISAPAFGPEAGYGYGIAVDKLDGHTRLRHTGGMVSFMSAIHMDLDAKIGAFASVNAQLGYRPNPVAQLAVQLLRAEKERGKAPQIPAFDPAVTVESPASYSAVYASRGGRRIEIKNTADKLSLTAEGRTIALQQSDDGSFIADEPGFNLFPLVFERAAAKPAPDDKSKPPVIALAYGPDWYARAGVAGQTPLEPLEVLSKYVGQFYSENPWNGTVRIVQRQHQLWAGGTDPLVAIGNHLFRVGAEPSNPGVLEYSEFIDGKPQLLWIDGVMFQRVTEATA